MTDRAKDLVTLAVERTIDDPIWFYREILRADPSKVAPWQIRATEVALDVRRKNNGKPTRFNHKGKQRITVRACHGPGKTHWLAAFAHLWNFTTYGLIAVTAPKQDQLRTRFFYRYKRLLSGSVPWYKQMIQADTLKASVAGDETWGIQGETASEPENLAGYHDTPQLFLIDEASGRRMDPMFPVIEGALTTPGSICIEIGNPTRDEGEFYEHHTRADLSNMYYRIHVKREDAPGLISQEWVDNMRTKYGENSPVFKVRALGEFAPMDRNQLISLTWVENCREAGEDDEALNGDGSFPEFRISVDVADGGEDFTVITAASHYDTKIIMHRQEKFNFPQSESPILAADAAESMFREYGGVKENDEIIVDGIGVGAGTAGELMKRGYRVVVFKGGNAAPGNFRNARSSCYIALRNAHQEERIVYSPSFTDEWDDYIGQLCSHRIVLGTEREEDVETKDAYIRRVRKSPDLSDSAMMQMTNQSPRISSGNFSEPEVVTHSQFGY